MIAKFKETGSFAVKRGRGRKPVSAAAVEDVATALQEQTSSDAGISSARVIICIIMNRGALYYFFDRLHM